MDGRKVYLNEWLSELIKNINKNIEINKKMDELNPNSGYLSYVDRDQNLLDKIDKYKKTDADGNVYFYFFPNELENMLWVFLENSFCKGDD